LLASNLGTSGYQLKKFLDLNHLETKREKDRELIKRKQVYNTTYPRDQISHAIDVYRLSPGSIKRLDHSRINYKINGNILIFVCLVNIKTQKRFYGFYVNGAETAIRSISVIQDAIDNKEEIKAIQVDRVQKVLITGLEKLGIDVVCYGKTNNYPYNSYAEQQFTNISKQFYMCLGSGYGHYDKRKKRYKQLLAENMFEGISIHEAMELFQAIIYYVLEHDIEPLRQYDYKITQKIEQIVEMKN